MIVYSGRRSRLNKTKHNSISRCYPPRAILAAFHIELSSAVASVGIYEECVFKIRAVCERHLLLKRRFLLFAHAGQFLLVLTVQSVVQETENNDGKTEQSESNNNTDFATDITGSLAGLERLGSENVSYRERHEYHGVGCHLLGVPTLD